MFTVYFFDADLGEVSPITIRKPIASEELRRLIGCEHMDTVVLPDNHVVICNEGGLENGLQSVVQFDGVPSPLAGNLIIAGVNSDGFATPSFSIVDAAERMSVVRPLLDPQVEIKNEDAAFSHFRIRLARHKPRVSGAKLPRLKLVR